MLLFVLDFQPRLRLGDSRLVLQAIRLLCLDSCPQAVSHRDPVHHQSESSLAMLNLQSQK